MADIKAQATAFANKKAAATDPGAKVADFQTSAFTEAGKGGAAQADFAQLGLNAGKLDKDGDGFITAAEVAGFATNQGNKDGKIEAADFTAAPVVPPPAGGPPVLSAAGVPGAPARSAKPKQDPVLGTYMAQSGPNSYRKLGQSTACDMIFDPFKIGVKGAPPGTEIRSQVFIGKDELLHIILYPDADTPIDENTDITEITIPISSLENLASTKARLKFSIPGIDDNTVVPPKHTLVDLYQKGNHAQLAEFIQKNILGGTGGVDLAEILKIPGVKERNTQGRAIGDKGLPGLRKETAD